MNIGNLEGIADLRGKLPHGAADYARRDLADLEPGAKLNWLVVHHTATAGDVTAHAIARYHVANLAWPGIGYHLLVHQDGSIDYVGDILQVRYNVASLNPQVIGVCLPGDFTNRPPGRLQLEAARDLLANLQFALGWAVPIAGHREIALPGYGTSCPGDTFLKGPRWKGRIMG